MAITKGYPVSAKEMVDALTAKEEVYIGGTTPTSSNIKVWIDTESPSTTLASLIYPVGSIYMSVSNTDPSTLFGGTWESIASGRVLMGVDSSHGAGTTAEAGLPNITGEFSATRAGGLNIATGSFSISQEDIPATAGSATTGNKYTFDASKSSAAGASSIYGKSTTVQPPAFYVYIWRRTA